MRIGHVTSLFLAAGALVWGCGGSSGFQPYDQITVNVVGTGTGAGTVVASDPAVPTNCTLPGPPCSDSFNDAGGGGAFNLLATPAAGSVFVGWTGCSASVGNACTLTFGTFISDTVFNVTARFDLQANNPLAEITAYNGTQTTGVTVAMQTPYDGPKAFGPLGASGQDSDSLQVTVGAQFQITATVGAKTGSATCTTTAGIIPVVNDPQTGNALAAVFMDVNNNVTVMCSGNWQ